MQKKEMDELHNNIYNIGLDVQKLADDLTHVQELDPDFTLIEIAKIHASLLNISSKIYVLRPDLAPKHLQDCNWHTYIPQ